MTKLASMKNEGVEKIIMEMSNDSDNYQRMLLESIDSMEEQDILVISTFDDLGINIDDIINVIEKLEQKDIGIHVLDAPKDLMIYARDWPMKRALRKQLLTILLWLKDKELDNIQKRESKAIEMIRSIKGRKKGSGRPRKYSKDARDPHARQIYYDAIMMLKNNIPITTIANKLNITRNTVYTIQEDLIETESFESESVETNMENHKNE